MEESYNVKSGHKKTKRGGGLRLVGLVVIILLFIGGGFLIYKNATDNDKQASNSAANTTIQYPEGWIELKPDQIEQQSGVIIKAGRNNPHISLKARNLVGKLSKGVKIDELPDKLVVKLKKETPGFHLISKGTLKIGAYDAVQVRYSDASSKNEEGTLIVIPTSSATYYLTFVNDKGNYSTTKDQIEQVTQNFTSYIQQHSSSP